MPYMFTVALAHPALAWPFLVCLHHLFLRTNGLYLPLAPQCLLKLDAASSAVDEQLRRREALEAEQAAGDARAKEKEAVVSEGTELDEEWHRCITT